MWRFGCDGRGLIVVMMTAWAEGRTTCDPNIHLTTQINNPTHVTTNKQRNSMDASVASKSNNAAARRASSGLAAEMVETESVGSRFSNRYDEDLEMGRSVSASVHVCMQDCLACNHRFIHT